MFLSCVSMLSLISVSWKAYNLLCAVLLNLMSWPFLKVYPPICRITVDPTRFHVSPMFVPCFDPNEWWLKNCLHDSAITTRSWLLAVRMSFSQISLWIFSDPIFYGYIVTNEAINWNALKVLFQLVHFVKTHLKINQNWHLSTPMSQSKGSASL